MTEEDWNERGFILFSQICRTFDTPNKAFAAERKKPRPLKSGVPGGYAAWNRAADYVKHLVPALAPEQGAW